MYQSFEDSTRPEDGPPRLALLQRKMEREGLAAFLVPRAEAHLGGFVAPCGERLAWLTGFTGSAGLAVVLGGEAAVFTDGRYAIQVREQVDTTHIKPIPLSVTKPADWIAERLEKGASLGFDPWLHSISDIRGLRERLMSGDIKAVSVPNPIDAIWRDRPPRPKSQMRIHPDELAGKSVDAKITEISAVLEKDGSANLILTSPDSICWLLNVRGSDIPHTPVFQAFAVLNQNGKLALFTDATVDADVLTHMGERVHVYPYDGFYGYLAARRHDTFRLDPLSAPFVIAEILGAEQGDARIVEDDDPCLLPKACKNAAEIVGATRAHLYDAVAMAEFLSWLERTIPEGELTEIDAVEKLEEFRRSSNVLRGIAFDTICGAGPNGAVMHYRVTRKSNRTIRHGELLLIDSGGQYPDGTTDITRTVCVGDVGEEEKLCFTRVLQGLIAMSRARWPKGLAGRDLDAVARMPLWLVGQDYDHGTGHGVGAYLGVHEGPAALSRRSDVPLEPGMILSIEPGCYMPGAFGVRIENLVVIEPASAPSEDAPREMLRFRTLTHVPVDRRLIRLEMLTQAERDWLNGYHKRTLELLDGRVSATCREWLEVACSPIPDVSESVRAGDYECSSAKVSAMARL